MPRVRDGRFSPKAGEERIGHGGHTPLRAASSVVSEALFVPPFLLPSLGVLRNPPQVKPELLRKTVAHYVARFKQPSPQDDD